MKKILFVTPHMICAGVEKALLNLLEIIPLNKYEIDILFVKAEGALLESIPTGIQYNQINLPKETTDILLRGGVKANIIHDFKELKFKKIAKNLYKRIVLKDLLSELDINFNEISIVEKKYDMAICYHIHMPFIVNYVADKIDATIKCAWIHNDFKETKYKVNLLESSLEKYDYYFGVSQELVEQFIQIFPQFSKRTSIFYNIISDKKIKNLSYCELDNGSEFEKEKQIKILTIGRLDPQKGYDLALKVCKILKHNSFDFKWYVLGEGRERKRLEKEIKKLGLEEYFILLGLRENPYPFLRNCDIYVQTSRHEGYCTTLNEARILAKPIVTTAVAGVNEMLVHNYNAFICDYDEQEMFHYIKKLIENEELRKCFSIELEKNKINTDNEISKLLRLCEA